MALLDIKTANPDISWVIYKNPNTQAENKKPFERTLRKGKVFGWYKDPTHPEEFRVWFKEGKGQSSFYKKLDNNYLNQSSYNCSYTYCGMIHEMLSASVKARHEKDIPCNNEVTISAMLITLPSVAQFFIKYFASKIKIEMTPLAKKAFTVKFSGHTTLFELVNLVQVFCLMQSIEDRNIYLDLSVATLKKYALALKNIQAPYFIAYLFLSRCVPDYDSFKEVKPVLEQTGWSLNYGNTQKQRYDAIKRFVQKGIVLHDIGCGELYYSRLLSSQYDEIYAWDADDAIQARNAKFLVKKQLKNIVLKSAFTQQSVNTITPDCDLLITEMLEHMPKLQSKEILQSIKNQPFRRLIITLPNHDFNQYYQLEHEFRHDDHYWEPTYEETQEFIASVFDSSFNVIIKPIGDGINGSHVSTLIVIERKL